MIGNTEREKSIRDGVIQFRFDIPQKFNDYMKSHGSEYVSNVPIIPSYDDSILFTNSTISTLKPFLLNGVPDNGCYTVQRCVRTKNLKYHKDQDPGFLKWSSMSNNIGTLDPYLKLDALSFRILKFLEDILKISQDRLRILSSSNDVDLMHFWRENGLEDILVLDTKKPEHYTHKFGLEDITGRNIHIALLDNKTGEMNSIGTIGTIEDKKGPFAVESTIGIETLVARKFNFDMQLEASSISDFIDIKDRNSMLLADGLATSITILRENIKPVRTNRGRILRSYLQSTCMRAIDLNLSPEEIKNISQDFELSEFKENSNVPSFIKNYFQEFEKLRDLDHGDEKGSLNKILAKNMMKFE